MANQVRVTSLDALETFRAHLIIFLAKAVGAVDEVGDEVRRTRSWVHNDQRHYWEAQIKKRRRALDQAQGEYMNARLSKLQDNTAAQKQAVAKAKRELAEAEEKLLAVKLWIRNFDVSTDPLLKRMSGLRQFLDFDMPKAVAFLVQAQKTLEAYTQIPSPEATTAPASPAAENAAPASPLPESP
jgi:hypothetical protein